LRFNISFFIIISLIISFYVPPSALSQEIEKPSEVKQAEPEEQEPPETKPQEIKQPEAGEAVPVPKVERVVPRRVSKPHERQGTVSFFFDDADIFEVAQTVFGDVLKVNYVIDPMVKGRVNFRTVTPIPKEEVLSVMEVILRLNGVGFVEEKGLYRIIPLEDVSKELVYSQIGKEPGKVAIELFTFKNLNLKDSMTDIENALGLHLQGGTARILPIYRLNALIVVASSKEQLEYIRNWIEVFDNMFSVAKPKIYVYPLQNSKASHIASLLQSIFSGSASVSSPTPASRTESSKSTSTTTTATPRSGAATVASGTGFLVSPETKVFADEITNSLIILSTPADYDFIEETIKKIDTVPRQVLIEGLLVRVDLTDELNLGVLWSFTTDLKITGIKPFKDVNLTGDISINPGSIDTTALPSAPFSFIGTDSKGNVRAFLSALAKDNKAKILAAPHILVSDNREARIQVGRQIPLATSTATTIPTTGTEVTTNTVTSTIQYKDTGNILKVKPQINDSGLVSLELSQENSDLGDSVTIAGQAFESINKTEASTNLVVQDGETIVIGGLIQESVTKSKTGVPLLMDIPIIGNLFSSTANKTLRTELILLLTPHVVKNIEEAGKVTSDYVDRYKGATKDKDINKFIKERGQKEKSGGDTDKRDPKQNIP
jgi:type II secretion system protein D